MTCGICVRAFTVACPRHYHIRSALNAADALQLGLAAAPALASAITKRAELHRDQQARGLEALIELVGRGSNSTISGAQAMH